MSKQSAYVKIQVSLEETPGQSVRELAERLERNRVAVAGYLQALEDLGYVTSRKIGPARVFHNAKIIEAG